MFAFNLLGLLLQQLRRLRSASDPGAESDTSDSSAEECGHEDRVVGSVQSQASSSRGPRLCLEGNLPANTNLETAESLRSAPKRLILSLACQDYDKLQGTDYAWAKALSSPNRDAELVESALKEIGYQEAVPLRNTSFHEFQEAFTEFLQSLDNDCYAAVMFFAGHGIETNSRLALLLNDPKKPLIYLDEILARLHERLDELLPGSSEDDPIRNASVVFFCDICREGSGASVIRDRRSVGKPTLPAPSRQQAVVYSCLSGGRAEDSSSSTDNYGHLAKALSDIICANVPHTLYSLYESANSRVQRSSRQLRRKQGSKDYMPPLAKQHAEIHSDSTLLDDQYDLFVDEAQGRQLRSWMLPLRRRDETDGDGLRVKLWKVTDVDSEDQCRQRIVVERDNFIAAKHEERHASLEDAAEKTSKSNEKLRSRLTKYKQLAEAAQQARDETAAELVKLKQAKQKVDRQLEEQRQKYEKLRAERPQLEYRDRIVYRDQVEYRDRIVYRDRDAGHSSCCPHRNVTHAPDAEPHPCAACAVLVMGLVFVGSVIGPEQRAVL